MAVLLCGPMEVTQYYSKYSFLLMLYYQIYFFHSISSPVENINMLLSPVVTMIVLLCGLLGSKYNSLLTVGFIITNASTQ